MDSTLRSTSVVVFNRLVIFVLKEADQIFRQLLNVTDDAALASGAVKKQPRFAYSCCASYTAMISCLLVLQASSTL